MGSTVQFFFFKFYVWVVACIYVCACVCLVPVVSNARNSCVPFAGSLTCSTEPAVSSKSSLLALLFANPYDISSLSVSGQLFPVCSETYITKSGGRYSELT